MCRNGGRPGTRPQCVSPSLPSSRARCSASALPAADASPNVRFGIQDDAWLVHGGGTLDERLDRLERLGVDVVRFNLHWDQIEAVARRVRLGGQRCGAATASTAAGSRPWSGSSARRAGRTAGRAPNFAPGAASFAGFARAAASRYRWVKQWLMWNEPNQARWLRPTTPATYVRQILNPGYAAIHAVIPGAKVARRRHRAARLERRRLAGELDPRDAQRPRPARCLRAPSRIRRAAARRRSRAAATTARRSRWRRSRG